MEAVLLDEDEPLDLREDESTLSDGDATDDAVDDDDAVVTATIDEASDGAESAIRDMSDAIERLSSVCADERGACDDDGGESEFDELLR